MSNKPNWEFVSTGGGRDDGINNAMIEQFSGNYNYSLAREVIQNSVDAKPKENNEPVTVVFNLEEFKRKEFPGQDTLLEALNAGKKYYKDDAKAQEFLAKAISCLENDVIPFLKISDFNTTGLKGMDDDKKGGWYNLVKATGSSPKLEGGGSFGIGKGAPFAASNLRVVFYSTLKDDGFTKFQGIAELVSHEVDKGIKRGVGSYGFGQGSLANPKDIPENFRRKGKTGTDIFIAGYKNEKGWQKSLVQSVLRNFWYAISQNDLIVKVESQVINKDNLEKLLIDHFVTEKFKDEIEPKGNPLQYYLAFKKGKEFQEKLATLGNVKFYFYQTEEHLNHVAMIRNSHMVIYSRRFNFPGNYAGVFICDDEKGSKELRKMEPPAHDKWITERNKDKGAKAMEEIIVFVRECLDQMKITKSSGVLDIPELYKYLPYDDGADAGEGEGVSAYTGEEAEEESSKQIQKKEIFEKPVVISPFKVAVVNTTNVDGNKVGKRIKKKKVERTKTKRKFDEDEFQSRSFLISQSKDLLEYVVILKGGITEKCHVKLIAVGEEGSEKLKITKVVDSTGFTPHFSGNTIHSIYLEEDKEIKMTVSIESPFKYSLKIDAYAL